MKKSLIMLSISLLSVGGLISCNEKPSVSSSEYSSSSQEVHHHVIEGIKYAGENSDPCQIGDMYIPDEVDSTTPGVIAIHGGAFKFGDVKMFSTHAKTLANMGVAVFCIDYRKVNNQTNIFPAAISDVKAAVRYLRANAEKYNVNPDMIVTWGESAGGYLATMAGLSGIDDTFDGDVDSNKEISSTIDMVVDFYGPSCLSKFHDQGLADFLGIPLSDVDNEEYADLVAASDPTNLLSKYTSENAPYFMIQHGKADSTVSCKESQYLYDSLVSAFGEGSASLELIDNAAHMDRAFYTLENLTKVVDTIKAHFGA